MDAGTVEGLPADGLDLRPPENKEKQPLSNGLHTDPRALKDKSLVTVRDATWPRTPPRRRSLSESRNVQSSRRCVSEEGKAKSWLQDAAREKRWPSRRGKDGAGGDVSSSNGLSHQSPRGFEALNGDFQKSVRNGVHRSASWIPAQPQGGTRLFRPAEDLETPERAGQQTSGRLPSVTKAPKDVNNEYSATPGWKVNGSTAWMPITGLLASVDGVSEQEEGRRSEHPSTTSVNGHIATPRLRGQTSTTPRVDPPQSEGERPSSTTLGRPEISGLDHDPASFGDSPQDITSSLRQRLASELSKSCQSAPIAAAYETPEVKMERLLNFILLPPHLEQVLWFGTFACFDAWLYMFTVLPLRFLRVARNLLQYFGEELAFEASFIYNFVYSGIGRTWTRYSSSLWSSAPSRRRLNLVPRRSRSDSETGQGTGRRRTSVSTKARPPKDIEQCKAQMRQQQRRASLPNLSASDRADFLKGLVIVTTAFILMKFDASMMYHSIRGQATIKLYVIYNVLEVSNPQQNPPADCD